MQKGIYGTLEQKPYCFFPDTRTTPIQSDIFESMKPFLDGETEEDFVGFKPHKFQTYGHYASTIECIASEDEVWLPLVPNTGSKILFDKWYNEGLIDDDVKSIFVCKYWFEQCLAFFEKLKSQCTDRSEEHSHSHPYQPICSFFIEGRCNRQDCDKLHIATMNGSLDDDDDDDVQGTSLEDYERQGRVIKSAMEPKSCRIVSPEQKFITREKTQRCMWQAIGDLQGNSHACPNKRSCSFAHSTEEQKYLFKDQEKAFTDFLTTHQLDDEDATTFFQFVYDELKQMFSGEHKDITRQILLKAKLHQKLSPRQLDDLTINDFTQMLRFWFHTATMTRSYKKRLRIAKQVGVCPDDLPTYTFSKWDDYVWPLARRVLPICHGYLNMMEVAGDGILSKQLSQHWKTFCRSGCFCTRGIHPHDHYIDEDGTSYAISLKAMIDPSDEETYDETKMKIQKDLDDLSQQYQDTRDKYHEIRHASSEGTRFVRVGEEQTVADELKKIKRQIYTLVSQKHKNIKYCDPIKFQFPSLHETVSKCTTVAQVFDPTGFVPLSDTSGAIVPFTEQRAVTGMMSTGKYSMFAQAVASHLPALEQPTPKPKTSQSRIKPTVQVHIVTSEPKPKAQPMVDGDGFTMSTQKERFFRIKAKKQKDDIDISEFITATDPKLKFEPEPEPESEPESESKSEPKSLLELEQTLDDDFGYHKYKQSPFAYLDGFDSGSDSESEPEPEPEPDLKPESTRKPFWYDSDDSDDETDDSSSTIWKTYDNDDDYGISFGTNDTTMTTKLIIDFEPKKIILGGFSDEYSKTVLPLLKKRGYAVKLTCDHTIQFIVKKLKTYDNSDVFTRVMIDVWAVFNSLDLCLDMKEIENNTSFELPDYITTKKCSAEDKSPIEHHTRLTGTDAEIYKFYMIPHRLLVKKRTMKGQVIGPLSEEQASLIESTTSQFNKKLKPKVIKLKDSTMEVFVSPVIHKDKGPFIQMIAQVLEIPIESIKF